MQDSSNTSSRILSREFPPLPHSSCSPSELLDTVGHPQLMDYTQPYVHERMNDAISSPQLLIIPKKASPTGGGAGNGSFCERAQIADKENCGHTKEESEAATTTSQYSNNTIEWIDQLVHVYRQREADWMRREVIYRTREAWLCQRLREAEQELKWWITRYQNHDQALCHVDEDDGGDSNTNVSPDRALYDTLSDNVSDEGSVTPSRHPSSSHCYGTTTAVNPTPSFHYPNDAYHNYGSPYQQSQDMMLDYTSNAWHKREWYSHWRNMPHYPTRRRRLQPIPTARHLIL